MTKDPRHLKTDEIQLVSRLLGSGGDEVSLRSLESYLVIEMDDGGMGSLKFESDKQDRTFGSQFSQVEFTDMDGTPVSATLNLDNHGELFELDIFKADFSPLRSLPR